MITPDWIKLGKVYPGAMFQDNEHGQWQIIIVSILAPNCVRAIYLNSGGSQGDIHIQTLNHHYHPLDSVRKCYLTTIRTK